MTMLRVWAPRAERLELESGGRLLAMSKDPNGWWSVEAPFIEHGVDYAFRVDGEGPFPDPRSPWQPEGVHGPSRWVDHARYEWNDAGWRPPPLASAVIYEFHIGTFTEGGTFESVIGRLDHLAELGVTHVELMPVNEFSGERGWGYDGVDLYAPHHAYGGPEGLKRLVDACHERGLAVLLDVVYNHLGPSGNYLGRFGPYFTGKYATPWGEAVNLDGAESDEVRRFFIDNALMWLRDYHFDGLRIDAIHAIVDASAIHFLEQMAAEVELLEARVGRELTLIAESDLNDSRVIRSPEAGGFGIDAQWNEDFHHALHAALTGERNGYYEDFGTLRDLAAALTRGFVYDGRYSVYRRRSHGRNAADLPGRRFVACLQNHDQTGNRALGERTSHLLSMGQLKIGAALVMTSPYVPMLFQGEEWAASTPFLYFTAHPDPELGEAVRKGRREEFAAFKWKAEEIPDPQDEATFLKSRLDWNEVNESRHAEMLEWHRALIRLRRETPSLRDDRLNAVHVRADDAGGGLVMVRGGVVVACNFSEEAQSLACPEAAGKELVMSSVEDLRIENERLLLPGHAVAILVAPDERAAGD